MSLRVFESIADFIQAESAVGGRLKQVYHAHIFIPKHVESLRGDLDDAIQAFLVRGHTPAAPPVLSGFTAISGLGYKRARQRGR